VFHRAVRFLWLFLDVPRPWWPPKTIFHKPDVTTHFSWLSSRPLVVVVLVFIFNNQEKIEDMIELNLSYISNLCSRQDKIEYK